jgi:hypothetical protein
MILSEDLGWCLGDEYNGSTIVEIGTGKMAGRGGRPDRLVAVPHLNRSLRSLVSGSAAAPSSGPTWKISCNVFRVELWS